MNYGKQGLKVLGLSLLAAFGLMAFGASGASASGSFLIKELLPPWEATISGAGENLLTGGILVLSLNIEIFCHSMLLTGTIKDTGHGHVKMLFSECLSSGTNSDGTLKGSVCTLEEDITYQGLILVILHNFKPYLLFSPLDKLTGAKVNGEPCIPSANLKGSFVASILNPDKDDVVKLISTKGMLTLFPNDKLFYGGLSEAHLSIDATAHLTGTHLNKEWGAL